jgi:hypothetical protein
VKNLGFPELFNLWRPSNSVAKFVLTATAPLETNNNTTCKPFPFWKQYTPVLSASVQFTTSLPVDIRKVRALSNEYTRGYTLDLLSINSYLPGNSGTNFSPESRLAQQASIFFPKLSTASQANATQLNVKHQQKITRTECGLQRMFEK